MSDLTGFLLARTTCSVAGCSRQGKLTRGMCTKHYRTWIDHTPPAERGIAPRFARRFEDYIEVAQDGCWNWTGTRNGGGYGYWSHAPSGERGLAHRVSLSRRVPAPAPGAMACHHCDNRRCVNPEHLYWGDAATNARDMVERHGVWNKGQRKEECPRGHPMSGVNLRVVGKQQKRMCRTCDNARARNRQRRRRAEAKV